MIRFACRTKVGGNITNEIKEKKLFGRRKLYSSATQSDLNAITIAHILEDVLPKHKKNVEQINHLRKVYVGNQAIYDSAKQFRTDINNLVVENHIEHAVSFKKSYVFGNPVQYVQGTTEADTIPIDNTGGEPEVAKEFSILNTYMRNNSKPSKDVDLAEELYVAGVAPRIVLSDSKDPNAPFKIYNLDPENAFVVYSNGIAKERLFGVLMTKKHDYEKKEDTLVLVVTTKTKKFTYNLPYADYLKCDDKIKTPTYVRPNKPSEEVNVLKDIPIVEYELNKNRISVVERMLGSQNALNILTSNEVNDVEQFVQAMLVFINADIDADTVALAKEMGAISIKSDNLNGQSSDVKILTSKLAHSDSKILYDRILHTALINEGVPLTNASGGSGGDTGLARLADSGWLMADTKARQDELSFIECEKPLLEIILKILKAQGKLKLLEISHIATKFTRNKSDNLLTKVQALQSLVGIVNPESAFELVDLFSDPNEIVQRSRAYHGDDFFKRESKENTKGVEPIEKIDENKETLEEA